MGSCRNNTATERLSRLEEQRLIGSVKRGDREAMRALIEQHQQRLFAFVWRVLPNHQDAEDVCQEALLKAMTAIDSFDPTYRFSTWLFTIAYRLALNSLRRRNKHVDADIDYSSFESTGEPGTTEIAESEEARRLKDAVWRAVDRLSTTQRLAVTLFYRERHSCQEISVVMDVPVATVKSHLHRARAKLKDLLEPAFVDDWQKLSILNAAIA